MTTNLIGRNIELAQIKACLDTRKNVLLEGIQNILLPAMDERVIIVPKLGKVKAEDNFRVISTQNPSEFIATSHLSEAILDRFEVILLNYQSESEEIDIVLSNLPDCDISHDNRKLLARKAVQIIRATRHDPRIRRGASVRAAISIAEISTSLISSGLDIDQAVFQAALMALPTRIEMESNFEHQEMGDKMHHSEQLTNLIQSIVYEDELKIN